MKELDDPIAAQLLDWYTARRRDLPWRRSHDPYEIWVSEVMLQQTQVATVLPYYERWMERFPNLEALAQANEEDVLSVWQGLGYYRRCRLLMAGARYVTEHGMPKTATGWRKVPGVGPYTAAAIASIAFGEPVGLVDGNVERVFARLTGCADPNPELKRKAWNWANAHVPPDQPGDWNQAVMELGATACRPREPACEVCPLADHCLAFARGLQRSLPTPGKRPQTVTLEREAWIHVCGDRYGLEQAPEGAWWQGMWLFPSGSPLREAGVRLGCVRHVVTKYRIAMSVFRVECESPLPNLTWFTAEELKSLPLPSPFRRAIALFHSRELPLPLVRMVRAAEEGGGKGVGGSGSSEPLLAKLFDL